MDKTSQVAFLVGLSASILGRNWGMLLLIIATFSCVEGTARLLEKSQNAKDPPPLNPP